MKKTLKDVYNFLYEGVGQDTNSATTNDVLQNADDMIFSAEDLGKYILANTPKKDWEIETNGSIYSSYSNSICIRSAFFMGQKATQKMQNAIKSFRYTSPCIQNFYNDDAVKNDGGIIVAADYFVDDDDFSNATINFWVPDCDIESDTYMKYLEYELGEVCVSDLNVHDLAFLYKLAAWVV